MIKIEEFAVQIMRLFESKLKPFTEQTVEVWYNELRNYPKEQVFEAINELIKSDDNFISVGKIISKFESNDKGAEIAWERCLQSARADGRKPIHAKDARALNSLGGMEKLCLATNEDLHWLKKDFLACYNNYENSSGEGLRCFGLKADIFPDTERQGLLTHG